MVQCLGRRYKVVTRLEALVPDTCELEPTVCEVECVILTMEDPDPPESE